MANQPHLQIQPGDVNPIALLPGDPGRVDRIAAQCTDPTTLTTNREYKVVNATYDDTPITICSTGIGCPSAAIAITELNNAGVTTAIRTGTTGGLQPEIATGDLIIATGAAKDEGTTKRYESATIPAVPDYHILHHLITTTRGHTDAYHVGPIVTDDAYYAETTEYVTDWEAAGILAVEMEAAAIFTLARRNNMQAGAICAVDGNLVTGTQRAETGESDLPDRTDTMIDQMITIVLDTVTTLE